ncbi:MAG TPA: serine/threonine-protein kinase, partial [Thermoanaerobaculia bacterium]|nr:serine/threonine-protein kinase [Thermoanaerobaculia bacterium]
MQLNPGHRLGPYEILGPAGSGGMGEVYRGRDTRLNRNVAIKILPAGAAGDEMNRSRFAREAKAISALAHPNICTLFDVGSDDGVDYLVMELLEGETLAEHLRRGAMPLPTLLRHAIAIADALEKAHASGVIHRDLKPGNMMVTKSGVKLLDFGLADLRTPRDVASEVDTSPLQGERLTAAGTILGTLDFMAPEQLEGRRADERTDIFALGNVLYRMASGRAPFAGASEAAMVASILNDDPPPIRERRPEIPAALERLIFDCLRKDPAERMQSAHDVKLQLQWIAQSTQTSEGRRRAAYPWLPWAAAALAVVATIA